MATVGEEDLEREAELIDKSVDIAKELGEKDYDGGYSTGEYLFSSEDYDRLEFDGHVVVRVKEFAYGDQELEVRYDGSTVLHAKELPHGRTRFADPVGQVDVDEHRRFDIWRRFFIDDWPDYIEQVHEELEE